MQTDSEPKRIAIIKPCCLGDCVMALPAVDALAAAYPTAEIDVFVGRHSMAAFQFRRRLAVRRIPDIQSARSALELSRLLRQGHYDIVACLDRSRWLRFATRMSRSRTSGSVQRISPEVRHESDVYLDVVRGLGLPTPVSEPSITPSDEARRTAIGVIGNASTPYAIIHPGGAQNPGVNMFDKRWPANRYVELARLLTEHGLTVLLSGSASERHLCGSIAEHTGLSESAVIAGRIDLSGLAAVFERAALYVGPDTGVSQIAAATGAPTVAIFGPTNPRRYRPLGPSVRVVAPADSWFIPDRDLRKEAANGTPTTDAVSVDAVYAACSDLLNELANRYVR